MLASSMSLAFLFTCLLAYLGSSQERINGIYPSGHICSKRGPGYVCAIGSPMWSSSDIIAELDSFMAAYRERDIKFKTKNPGGNGMFHSFGLWFVIRKLRPPVVIESGVYKGETSWLLRKATAAWEPIHIRMDPMRTGWQDDNKNESKVYSYRGTLKSPEKCVRKNCFPFQDFNDLPWRDLIPNSDDRSRAFVFFDDHQDQVVRLQQTQRHGFGHVMFDDNFVPGFGDIFSIKNACDGGRDSSDMQGRGGALRRIFSTDQTPRRCTRFHELCNPMSEAEAAKARSELLDIAETLWEVPPLVPLVNPYGAIKQYAFKGAYEGPRLNMWKENVHTCLIQNFTTKSPVLPDISMATRRLGTSMAALVYEGSRYMNMVYVKLRAI